jgi:spore germination protein KC
MKRPRFTIYVVLLLIIIPLFISGCWDSRELNKLSIVSGLGWDIDTDTGEVTLTFQNIIPSEIKSSSGSNGGNGGQKGGNPLRTIQLDFSTGSSPYDALNRYAQHGSRTTFYQHAQVYVFGKDAAQQGLYPFLDSTARNPVNRPNVLMVVSEKKARDVLEIQDGMENIPAIGMAAEIKLSATYSKYPEVTYLDFANRLKSKTTAPIIPMVGILEQSGPEGEKIRKTRITGTAVFKGDRMIGELNERESSGLLWAINKIKRGFVIIPDANLETIRAKSNMVPELQGDKIKITVEIEQESNLLQYSGHQDLTSEILHELEKSQAKEIESQVLAAVEKSFSLNADVFGFGDAVHRKYKKEWQELKPRWDEFYPYIEVVVKVKTHINEIGDINKALLKD